MLSTRHRQAQAWLINLGHRGLNGKFPDVIVSSF